MSRASIFAGIIESWARAFAPAKSARAKWGGNFMADETTGRPPRAITGLLGGQLPPKTPARSIRDRNGCPPRVRIRVYLGNIERAPARERERDEAGEADRVQRRMARPERAAV